MRDLRGDIYKIIEVLAEGPVTMLLRVSHPRSDRMERALKLLRCSPELNQATRAARTSSFSREIRFMEEIAQLHHPCLLQMIDHGATIEGEPFMILEPLHGESLRAYLDRRGPLSFQDAVTLCRPIAAALDALHHKKIVHRDLSPENLYVRVMDTEIPIDPQVKIIDFGLSKYSGHVLHTGLHSAASPHAAPEQAAGQAVIDQRADQFSFASLFTEVLTGQPATAPADPFAGLPANAVPPSALGALRRALQRTPRERFGTISDFWRQLCGARDPRETTMLPQSSATLLLRKASNAPRSFVRRLWPF